MYQDSTDLYLSDEDYENVLKPRRIDRDVRQYFTVTADDAKALGFKGVQCRPGVVYISHGLFQDTAPVLRAYEPRLDAKGKPVKYDRIKGAGNFLDVNPKVRDAVLDVPVVLDFFESPMKADSAISRKLTDAAIGLNGVRGFHATVNNGKVFSPDLEHIPLKGRGVRIIFDSNIRTNLNVQAAARRLKKYLEGRGAIVTIVVLPLGDDGGDQGIDDLECTRDMLAKWEQSEVPGPGIMLPAPGSPSLVADELLKDFFTDDDGRATLLRYQGEFYEHRETHWKALEKEEIDKAVRDILKTASYEHVAEAGVEIKFWNPNDHNVKNVINAMSATRLIPNDTAFGSWLGQPPKDSVGPFWSMENGILDLETKVLHDQTPNFFTTTASPFEYDPEAPCDEWKKFLRSVWDEDSDEAALLAEWYGYVISGRTDHQKGFYLLGPTGSGKGTARDVLFALVGKDNTHTSVVSQFCSQFGMEKCVGKTLVVIPDARYTGRDSSDFVEKLNAIIGNDSPGINRKNKTEFSGPVGFRMMFMSNDMLNIRDASGAVVKKFLIVKMTKSFRGTDEEDVELGGRLLKELPGIFNWALAGLDRLKKNKRFTNPEASQEEMDELLDVASPMQVFVRECCDEGKDKTTGKAFEISNADFVLSYGSWYLQDQKIPYNAGAAKCIQTLHSAAPAVRTARRTKYGSQRKFQTGIRVKSKWLKRDHTGDSGEGWTDVPRKDGSQPKKDGKSTAESTAERSQTRRSEAESTASTAENLMREEQFAERSEGKVPKKVELSKESAVLAVLAGLSGVARFSENDTLTDLDRFRRWLTLYDGWLIPHDAATPLKLSDADVIALVLTLEAEGVLTVELHADGQVRRFTKTRHLKAVNE